MCLVPLLPARVAADGILAHLPVTRQEVEEITVANWRLEQFLNLGFDLHQATLLGTMTEVHHSYAKRMLDNGWTHEMCIAVLA